MSLPTAGDLLRGYYQTIDAGRLEDLGTLFDPEITWLFPGTTVTGLAAATRVLGGALATGLTMRHDIGHLVERDGVAMCELVATNHVGGRDYVVTGAVVCESRDGRITRLAAYPEAGALQEFQAALGAARRAR